MIVKVIWCVRCGQPAHVNGRGELVHDNYMVTANDHAVDAGKAPIPGTVNGFRVLAAVEVTPLYDERPEWVVLCDRGIGYHDRYVTWRVHHDPAIKDRPYVAHTGHYITDFRLAMVDFAERGSLLVEQHNEIRTLEGMVRERDELIDRQAEEITDLQDLEDDDESDALTFTRH
jgi:hypothetical protein